VPIDFFKILFYNKKERRKYMGTGTGTGTTFVPGNLEPAATQPQRPQRPLLPEEELLMWVGGVFDNIAVLSQYNGYMRVTYTHRSASFLNRIAWLTDHNIITQQNSEIKRVIITGRPFFDHLLKIAPYIYVREEEVRLVRELLDRGDFDTDEIEAELIRRNGTVSKGRPGSVYWQWYYSRYKGDAAPPPTDMFWPYMAGVLESRALQPARNAPAALPTQIPLSEVIHQARTWLLDLYGLSIAADTLHALPADFSTDVMTHIQPYLSDSDR
jgi:hypothetical protein